MRDKTPEGMFSDNTVSNGDNDVSCTPRLIGNKPYKCVECGAAFKRSDHLKSHKLTHSTEKSYKCDTRGLNFLSKERIEIHPGKHRTGRPFGCIECGATFTRNYHLQRHLISHTGVRPYKCKDCGHSFKSNEHLYRHLEVHRGDKPFKCAHCSAQYFLKHTLDKHMRLHDGAKKSHHCGECDANFSSKFALSHHLNSKCHRSFKCSKHVRDHYRRNPPKFKQTYATFRWQSHFNHNTLIIRKILQPNMHDKPSRNKCTEQNCCFRIRSGENSKKCIDCGQAVSLKQCAVNIPRVSNSLSLSNSLPLMHTNVKGSDTKVYKNVEGDSKKEYKSFNDDGTNAYKNLNCDGENKRKNGDMNPNRKRKRKCFKRSVRLTSSNSRCTLQPRRIMNENRQIDSNRHVHAGQRECVEGRTVLSLKQTFQEYAKCSVRLTRIATKETLTHVGESIKDSKREETGVTANNAVTHINESHNDNSVLLFDEHVRHSKFSTELGTLDNNGKMPLQDGDCSTTFKENDSSVTDSREPDELKLLESMEKGAALIVNQLEECSNSSYSTSFNGANRPTGEMICQGRQDRIANAREKPALDGCCSTASKKKDGPSFVTDCSEPDDTQPLVSIENGAVLIVNQLQECSNSFASFSLGSSGETSPQFGEINEARLSQPEEKALYNCQECGAAFSCVQNLVAHIRLHDSEERGGDDLPYYDF